MPRHPRVVDLVFATSNTLCRRALRLSTDLTYIRASDGGIAGGSRCDLARFAAQDVGKCRQAGCRRGRQGGGSCQRTCGWIRRKLMSALTIRRIRSPILLPAPYGLPELNRGGDPRQADVVATPGCYPTTTLLGLYPLLQVRRAIARRCAGHCRCEIRRHRRWAEAVADHALRRGLQQSHSLQDRAFSHRHVGELEQEAHKAGTARFGPYDLLPASSAGRPRFDVEHLRQP